jgi:hypothetical protein
VEQLEELVQHEHEVVLLFRWLECGRTRSELGATPFEFRQVDAVLFLLLVQADRPSSDLERAGDCQLQHLDGREPLASERIGETRQPKTTESEL